MQINMATQPTFLLTPFVSQSSVEHLVESKIIINTSQASCQSGIEENHDLGWGLGGTAVVTGTQALVLWVMLSPHPSLPATP